MKNGCRYRYSWWDEPKNCGATHRRRGWVFGYCVDHALGHLRWERAAHDVHVTVDFGNVHRLNWQVDDDGLDGPEWAALSWGESGCAPVWSVQFPVNGLARRVMARVFWPREWRQRQPAAEGW